MREDQKQVLSGDAAVPDDEGWDDSVWAMRMLERWQPNEAFGWTWVCTMDSSPEIFSLFDSDGELVGHVYQRAGRVICWAPYTLGGGSLPKRGGCRQMGVRDRRPAPAAF